MHILIIVILLFIWSSLFPGEKLEEKIDKLLESISEEEKNYIEICKRSSSRREERREESKQILKEIRLKNQILFETVTEEECAIFKDIYKIIPNKNSQKVTVTGKYNELVTTYSYKGHPTYSRVSYIGKHEVEGPFNEKFKLGKIYTIKGVYYDGKIYILEKNIEKEEKVNYSKNIGLVEMYLKEKNRRCNIKETNENIEKTNGKEMITEDVSFVDTVKKINKLKTVRNLKMSEYPVFFIPMGIFAIGSIFAGMGLLIEDLASLVAEIFILIGSIIPFVVFKLKKIPVYENSGKIKKINKHCVLVDGIKIFDNYNWFDGMKDDEYVTMEGIKKTIGNIELEAVKVEKNSLEKEYKKFNKYKFIYYLIMIGMYSLFTFIIGNMDSYKYYKYNLPKEKVQHKFNNYNEIKNYDFYENQYVEFNNIKYIIDNKDEQKIYLLKDYLPEKYDKNIEKWEKKIDKLQEFLDDLKDNNFTIVSIEKYKEYEYFDKYKKFIEVLNKGQNEENQPEIRGALYYFIKDYLQIINEEIEAVISYQSKQVKKNIVIEKNLKEYRYYAYQYNEFKVKINRPNFNKAFYGEESDFKGTILKVTREEDGTLLLKLTNKKMDDPLKSGKTYEFLMKLEIFILIILLILFLREISKLKNRKKN